MAYPFDPVGNQPTNIIVNESRTINSVNGVNVNYFFPDAAPFYADSVTVVDAATGNALVPYVDFTFGHEYVHGSSQIGEPIWGSVILTDPNRTGTYLLNYRTVGGEFVNEGNALLVDGIGVLAELQNLRWEDIANLPETFPPTPHNHPVVSFDGIADIIGKLEEIRLSLESSATQIQMADIVDLETAFVSPIINNLAFISANIDALNVGKQLYHLEKSTLGALSEIVPTSIGSWENTTLSLTVAVSGRYKIEVSPYIEATWSGAAGKIETRWVIGNSPVASSKSKLATVVLTAGQTIKLQMRAVQNEATKITYGNSHGDTSLFLTKLSN